MPIMLSDLLPMYGHTVSKGVDKKCGYYQIFDMWDQDIVWYVDVSISS